MGGKGIPIDFDMTSSRSVHSNSFESRGLVVLVFQTETSSDPSASGRSRSAHSQCQPLVRRASMRRLITFRRGG